MLKDLLTAFINKATIEANEILEKSGRKMLTNFDFAEAVITLNQVKLMF